MRALLILLACPLLAFAQDPKTPTTEDVAAMLNVVIDQRNDAMNRAAALLAELRKVQAALAEAQKMCKAKESK